MILSNGYRVPDICFGTDIVSNSMFSDCYIKQIIKRCFCILKGIFRLYPGYKKDFRIIRCANASYKNGVRFFDTSRAYSGSEKMLSQALRKYRRDDYYICTKLMNRDQLLGKSAREALMESMNELGVEYVDVYLLHWPVAGKFLDYWKQLEELYNEGLVRAIGVSNCKIHHLEEIKKVARITPMINEVEIHPLLTEKALLNYCKENNIQVMAYTSTARLDFRLRNSKRMMNICKETGKGLSQVILRWHIQNGVIPIFNSGSIQHLKENMSIFDFVLSEEQMNTIDGMNINSRTRYDSDNCEWDRL